MEATAFLHAETSIEAMLRMQLTNCIPAAEEAEAEESKHCFLFLLILFTAKKSRQLCLQLFGT